MEEVKELSRDEARFLFARESFLREMGLKRIEVTNVTGPEADVMFQALAKYHEGQSCALGFDGKGNAYFRVPKGD